MVNEMRSNMRFNTSADRYQIRQHYIPAFNDRIFKYLAEVCSFLLPHTTVTVVVEEAIPLFFANFFFFCLSFQERYDDAMAI